MVSLKEAAIETIRRMPERSSLEDIMYELNFIGQVLEGLDDAESGRLMTTEELLERAPTPGVDHAPTEVVHCKSQSEYGSARP